MNQQTLARTYCFEGKGLHTGKYAHVRFCPAPADTGVVFIRTDLGGAVIPAKATNVSSTRRSTRLGRGKAVVGTVEHALSALYGMGIDNAYIEIDNVEMPILDGSAAIYVSAMGADRPVVQNAPRKWIKPTREIIVRNERSGGWIKIVPASEPSFSITIDFQSRVLGKQSVTFDSSSDYCTGIAPCRTFCFLDEIIPQLALGLIKGGDISNALVIVEKPVSSLEQFILTRLRGMKDVKIPSRGYLGNPSLRFPDECGRHKMLDLLGDISLCGGFLQARLTAYKPGHSMNTSAAKELYKSL